MKALPDNQRDTPRHPIAVVAERTALTQDVLRVWERRYRAVQPTRGAGGHRLYSDADIERLALLSAATRAGRSVGQVAQLSTDALAALVEEDAEARARRPPAEDTTSVAQDVVSDAIALARSLDGAALDEVLRRAATASGISAFLEDVAIPLLRRVGDEWHAGRLTPAQEHLASAILYDLITETMRAFTQRDAAPKLLVATLAGERHVIGAALVGAAAAVDGWAVVYLGGDLPAAEIADAAKTAGARVVAVSVVYIENRERVLGELRALRARLPVGTTLIVGGGGAVTLADDLSVMDARVESSVAGLLAELRRDA